MALYRADRELQESTDTARSIFTVQEEDYGYDLATVNGIRWTDEFSDEE